MLSLLGIEQAYAQFSTTTANSAVNALVTDVGSGIGTNVTIILGILAGLLVLGWGIRAFRKHVTGKKF